MPFRLPNQPCVDSALKETRDHMFRGNTYGQNGAYHELTDAEREEAENFDVGEARRIAIEERKAAGIKD